VDKASRGQSLAAQLVAELERYAAALGLHTLYLLTETADQYFEKKGYERIHRAEVPEALKASTEFSHVCPASATVMKKALSASN
jgi:amino-acid N-acetyltransferase